MDKLSSILPGSPRVKSVDLKSAHPVRPGTPRWGRPEGSVSSDRMNISQAAKEIAFQETMGGRNPREAVKTKIAENITRKFFENRLEPDIAENNSQARQEVELAAPMPLPTKEIEDVPDTTTAAMPKSLDVSA